LAPQPSPEVGRETLRTASGASPRLTEGHGLAGLQVTVRWESDGTRAVGVGVQIRRPGDPQDLDGIEGETNSDGMLLLGGIRPGKAWIAADRSEETEVDFRSDERAEIAIKIPSGVDVRGRVVDHAGLPVSGAGIWISWAQGSRGR